MRHSDVATARCSLKRPAAAFMAVVLAGVMVAACAGRPDPARLSAPDVVERMAGGTGVRAPLASLQPAIEGSLRYVRSRADKQGANMPAASALESPVAGVSWSQLEASLLHLRELLPRLGSEPELLLQEFVWLKLEPDALLTGYYEPWLEASLTPSPQYRYPLYAMPPEAQEGEPLPTREDIDSKGVLAARGLEIAWAKSPVDVFFLQVQGSGRLLLPDGRQLRARYAGSNGHPYVSLGKKLIERGLSTREEMSMQTIREILEADPVGMQALMNINPKYIFFAIDDDGPFGATGAKLTSMLSCATDKTWVPMGAVLIAAGALPGETGGGAEQALTGLLLAQDTGTMHRNHLDLFCGSGPQAAELAGRMSGRAAAWVLVSRRVLQE